MHCRLCVYVHIPSCNARRKTRFRTDMTLHNLVGPSTQIYTHHDNKHIHRLRLYICACTLFLSFSHTLLHIYIAAHVHIYTSTHLHIYTPTSHARSLSHALLHACISTKLHICTSSHPYIYIATYQHIYISTYLHIYISTHRHLYISRALSLARSLACVHIYKATYLHIYTSIHLHSYICT